MSLKKKLVIFIPLFIVAFALDFFSKLWAVETQIQNQVIIPNVLSFNLVYNSGVSFSLFSQISNFWIFSLIISLAAFIFGFYLLFNRNMALRNLLFLTFTMAGILGNCIDRIFEPTHRVIDFIQYFDWFIGNVADIEIVLSVSLYLLFYLILYLKSSDKSNKN